MPSPESLRIAWLVYRGNPHCGGQGVYTRYLARELTELGGSEFKDLDKVDIVGVYPNYASAYVALKAKAQQTVDNAHMRYFIVHLHILLDPETTGRTAR